ncbi:hypothetical protein SAMN02745866_00009 [Alteromonadaceae bacterium Bs31]|nr:hypothetical protein SAMN02745866_00009 [Alteromonadaceae bacterium Bs31]
MSNKRASLSLDASGGIRSGEDIIDDSIINKNVGVFAPLPLFGLDFWHAYTERWGIGTKISIVEGAYNGIDAGVFDTTVRARYKLSKHFYVLMGIKYFSADVGIAKVDYDYEVAYRTDAVFAALY